MMVPCIGMRECEKRRSGILALLLVTSSATAAPSPHAVHAGINIPPPPHNRDGEFFFNSSNAVSFSDAYFDYSSFDAGKLASLFKSQAEGGFGFTSARIQLNAKTALKRWYLSESVNLGDAFLREAESKVEAESLMKSVFSTWEAVSSRGIPRFLVDENSGRPYLTPLQAVEYVVSYTNLGNSTQPRRAIFNFCGTCTKCTDDHIPPPNLDNHGTGTVDDCDSYTAAMTSIIDYFSDDRFANDDLHFELLNEPHAAAINDPKFRNCLLNVGKYASKKRGRESIIWPAANWEDHAAVTYDYEKNHSHNFPSYDIGWHIYPWACTRQDKQVCTVQDYQDLVLDEQELPMRSGALPKRAWLTEFGSNLYNSNIDYFDPEAAGSPPDGDARDLKGIANVLGQTYAAGCSQIRGLFLWHGGYFFDDSYTINGHILPDGKNGASFVKQMMADVNSDACADCSDYFGRECDKERCGKCQVGAKLRPGDSYESFLSGLRSLFV